MFYQDFKNFGSIKMITTSSSDKNTIKSTQGLKMNWDLE